VFEESNARRFQATNNPLGRCTAAYTARPLARIPLRMGLRRGHYATPPAPEKKAVGYKITTLEFRSASFARSTADRPALVRAEGKAITAA